MEFISLEQLSYVFRLLVACVCGFAIGFERKNRGKEAGIRTHCVVACASALMMIISKYGFMDLPDSMRGADGARIAAQVVSGIGFLGAGMIFVHKNTIKGLTTAAGIWATAGIGMAIGAGMYFVGIVSTAVIFFIQILLHGKASWLAIHVTKALTVYGVDEESFKTVASEKLATINITVSDVTVVKHGIKRDYTFFIELIAGFDEDRILELFPEHDAKIGGSM